MALEAIRHGKHVYSEKPLALNAHDAREMVDAAKRAGVKTLVGFNYMKNPTAQLAKEIIARGEIGEVIHFYGTHNEDYMADPLSLFTGTVLKRPPDWGLWVTWRHISSIWPSIWWERLSRSVAI